MRLNVLNDLNAYEVSMTPARCRSDGCSTSTKRPVAANFFLAVSQDGQSAVLFPIGKRRFIAPVRQLLHSFFMRRSRHKRSDRLMVAPHCQCPEGQPFCFSHPDAKIPRGSFRLRDRAPGVPKKSREKAQGTQVKPSDGDNCHNRILDMSD